MRAMLIDSQRNLVWQEVDDPVPAPGQVVIDVRATALNRADLLQRAGHYPSPPGWPQWMGLEVAGVISHAPAGGRWRVGDKVCALLGGGGYAQKAAVPAEMVLPIPEGLSFEQAACLPEVFATAWLNLCIEGGMKAGDTVFIQAGASGLGIAAIQLAHLMGAKVVTTVGSPEKADFVRSFGVSEVIEHRREDVAQALSRYAINIALDCVAGPQLGACLKAMAPGGRWIVIATLAGAETTLDMNDFFRRGVKLIGSTLRSRTDAMKASILAELERHVWPALVDGRLSVVIHKTLPMAQAEEAHGILKRNENLGKVVLTVEPS